MKNLVWHIGDVIRKLREAHGWTKGHVARKAGLEPNTVGSVELLGDTVSRDPETLRRLCLVFHTDTATLHALVPVPREAVTLAEDEPQEVTYLRKRLGALTPDQRKVVLAVIDEMRGPGEGETGRNRDEGHQPNTGTP